MRLAWNLKKEKMKTNIENLILELTGEVRTLRKEVMLLQQRIADDKMSGRFMSMKDACMFLHISRTTMQKRLADGDFSFAVKKGKCWLFPADKLRQYASGLI